MLNRLLRAIDGFSRLVGGLAMAMIALLVAAMFYEVVARYAFHAPTVWSYDISYMLNGTIFLLGAGLAMSKNLHVRIDFLSSHLPVRIQHGLNLVFHVAFILPIFGVLAFIATKNALTAFLTGELEPVSPWAAGHLAVLCGGFALGLGLLLLPVFRRGHPPRHRHPGARPGAPPRPLGSPLIRCAPSGPAREG